VAFFPLISSLKQTNFGLGAILLSCLAFQLQKPPLPGLEPGTLFLSFDLSEISLVARHWHAEFWGKLVYPFSGYTHIHPTISVSVVFKIGRRKI
jgi:hypothetical protein